MDNNMFLTFQPKTKHEVAAWFLISYFRRSTLENAASSAYPTAEMAEVDSPVRQPEPIIVTVLRATNLKGQKGDTLTALVKLEYIDRPLGESAKVDCGVDKPAEFNYNATVTILFEDQANLDEVAHRPVLCTVMEVLPKEKKQKDEKTVVLGQCVIDLFPLLQGETKYKTSLNIIPTQGSPLESLPADHPKPELDIQLSVNEPLLTETQRKDANLMAITMETLFSPPESWAIGGAQQGFTYIAAMPMPLNAERDNKVVFAPGVLKPPPDKEPPNKQKKWPVQGNAEPSVMFIPSKFLSSDNIEDEDGDFKQKDDRDHRSIAENEKNRVTWNIERRCFLDVGATKIFQDKIAKTRYWPVEVFRMAMPSAAKGKKDVSDDTHVTFHGVVYINLAPLLYPGVKRIRGAYKVHPYYDADLFEKTQRKGAIADESSKIAFGMLSAGGTAFPRSGGGKKEAEGKGKEGGKAKGGGTQGPEKEKPAQKAQPEPLAADADVPPAVNVEGQLYADAKSYVMIEIELHRPLVPKRLPEELAQKVAEYIPPRPLFPKRTNGAQKSVEEFHTQVSQVAQLILDEYRRQLLMYHLNSSGKYFAFKEQLKYAVVKIVREKYLKTVKFQDSDELKAFLSELYVYLLDQMHVGLNKFLLLEDESPIPEPLTDVAQLKLFAREAEVNENFELAAKFYQERIARDRNNPNHWLDYGTFCLYLNDLTKAEECFKECVSIDQRHLHGLLLYGVVCTMQDKHEPAETFFETATSVEPRSMLAWTMLGLFYDGIGNGIGTEMALLEANKLNAAFARAMWEEEKERERQEKEREKEAADRYKSEKEKGDDTSMKDQGEESKEPPEPPEKQLDVKTDKKSRNKHTSQHPPVKSPRPAKSPLEGRIRSTENMSRAGSSAARSPTTGAPQTAPAPEENEMVSPIRETSPVPLQTVYMQVIEFLLDVKAMPFTERALAYHLLEPTGGPSAEYHIALARLKLQKRQLQEAAESLQEALQFDHQSADAWAILGHVKYLMGDMDMAKNCYERTLAFVSDPSEVHSIYLRLASIYLHEGRFQEAKNTFLMACKKSPTCVSWLGVGMACYRLDQLEEAEDALSEANILNNSDPEVWAYLSMVCLKTGRRLEAEQALKYAIKVNLEAVAPELLTEITIIQEEVGFGNPQL
ncbi:Cilia- and flagella-associated protein 70 [Lamellibrachia satsuma]|nr:Cilia- and flagella-associated protein 70 [Lamellibrachia satsuma]